jgi:thiol:disulfide interchange protein
VLDSDLPRGVEHTSRSGRWLRERRFRFALSIAAVEALLVWIFHDVSQWTVIALAIIATLIYWYAGRKSQSETAHQASWIFAVSQLAAVVAVIVAAIVVWTAIFVAVVFAVVALFFVLTDRR